MVENGWAEEARAIATPTLLSLGGFGQNDVPVLNFLAWRKATAIGQCLDSSLAVLAAIASQALYVAAHEPPPNLRELTDAHPRKLPSGGPATTPRRRLPEADRRVHPSGVRLAPVADSLGHSPSAHRGAQARIDGSLATSRRRGVQFSPGCASCRSSRLPYRYVSASRHRPGPSG